MRRGSDSSKLSSKVVTKFGSSFSKKINIILSHLVSNSGNWQGFISGGSLIMIKVYNTTKNLRHLSPIHWLMLSFGYCLKLGINWSKMLT